MYDPTKQTIVVPQALYSALKKVAKEKVCSVTCVYKTCELERAGVVPPYYLPLVVNEWRALVNGKN